MSKPLDGQVFDHVYRDAELLPFDPPPSSPNDASPI